MDDVQTQVVDPLDLIEGLMGQCETIVFHVEHVFKPGLYIRTIFMPPGKTLTSKIHKTQHPYFVSKGKVNVLINGVVEQIEAPYWGITMPGTRRLLHVPEDSLEDCVWTTFHATDKTTPEEVEEEIIEAHDNPFLSEEIKLKYNLNQKICHLQQ